MNVLFENLLDCHPKFVRAQKMKMMMMMRIWVRNALPKKIDFKEKSHQKMMNIVPNMFHISYMILVLV